MRMYRLFVFQVSAGDRPGIPNVAIIMTDGESTIDRAQTLPEAQKARDAGINIYAIGVGDKVLLTDTQILSQ